MKLKKRCGWFCVAACFVLLADARWAQSGEPSSPGARRILVLGDSITYSGQYVEFFEAYLRLRYPEWDGEVMNLGLPSETVSGLSEEGHAGGQFPRPDLHERLDRVLGATKPDLVIACYGMNDGIYLPFSDDRFQRFQDGIRRLRQKAKEAGARMVHLTPPTYDPGPGKSSSANGNYNDVLDRYSDWLLAQRSEGWTVLDIHGPMNGYLAEHRQKDPDFRLAGDGVHPNETGHWLMALPLMAHFDVPAEIRAMGCPGPLRVRSTNSPNLLRLTQERQRLMKDAWLSQTGHKRPGMNKGMPLAEAQRREAELGTQIRLAVRSALTPGIVGEKGFFVITPCADPSTTRRYTLDGGEPTIDSGAYLAPIFLPAGGTIKTRAFRKGMAVGGTAELKNEVLGGQKGLTHSAIVPVTQNRDWRTYDWPTRHSEVCALIAQRKPELVFIGDSITHFFGGEPKARVANGAEVWQKFYAPRNAVNLGFGWDRTENVLWRLQHGEIEGASPKVVVLLIGTNNLDVNTADEVAEGIEAVCRELHTRLPATKVLVLGILPRSPKPDARRAKIAQVNARLSVLGGRDGVTYLDIGPKFLGADGAISRELMGDYLHPTAKGYAVMAEAIEPSLVRLWGEH